MWKMEKKVLFLAIFMGLLQLGCVIFYDYSQISGNNLNMLWIIHICILSLDLTFVLIHLLLYETNRYTVFILLSLIFFLVGDIFVQAYDQPFENFIDNPAGYIVLAGCSYFIARVILTVIFAMKDGTEIVEVDKKVLIFTHFLFTLPYLAFGITFLALRTSYVSGFIFIYLFLCFGFLQSYALIRMIIEKGIMCLIFSSLLNFSHVILICFMYSKAIPHIMKPFATNTYWVSLFLLALSIVPRPKQAFLYTQIEEF